MEFVYERKPVPSDEGSVWLYRDPKSRKHHRVEIDTVPDSPSRVRIQHLDRDKGGKAEWVPVGRLKVPWNLREDYFVTEALWEKLLSHSPKLEQRDAAELTFALTLNGSIANMDRYASAGVLEIVDLAELVRVAGLSEEDDVCHPDMIRDTSIYVPWPVTERVARALCKARPRPIVEYLHDRVGEKRKEEIENGEPWWVEEALEGDRFAQRVSSWAAREAATDALLSEWVSGEHASLLDDYLNLREMYSDVVDAALPVLKQMEVAPSQKAARLAGTLRGLIERPMPWNNP